MAQQQILNDVFDRVRGTVHDVETMGDVALVAPPLLADTLIWVVGECYNTLLDPTADMDLKEAVAGLMSKSLLCFRGASDAMHPKDRMNLDLRKVLYRLTSFKNHVNPEHLDKLLDCLGQRTLLDDLAKCTGKMAALGDEIFVLLPRGARLETPLQAQLLSLQDSIRSKDAMLIKCKRQLRAAQNDLKSLRARRSGSPSTNVSSQQLQRQQVQNAEYDIAQLKLVVEERDEQIQLLLTAFSNKEEEAKQATAYTHEIQNELGDVRRDLDTLLRENYELRSSKAQQVVAPLPAPVIRTSVPAHDLELDALKRKMEAKALEVFEISTAFHQKEEQLRNAVEYSSELETEIFRLKEEVRKLNKENERVVGKNIVVTAPVQSAPVVESSQPTSAVVQDSSIVTVANVSGPVRRVRRRDPNNNRDRKPRTPPTQMSRKRLSSGSDPDTLEDGVPPLKVLVVDRSAQKDKSKDLSGEKEVNKEDSQARLETDLSKTVAPVSNVLGHISVDRRDELDVEVPSEKTDESDIFDEVDKGTSGQSVSANVTNDSNGQDSDQGGSDKATDDQDTQAQAATQAQAPTAVADPGAKADLSKDTTEKDTDTPMELDSTQDSERAGKDKDKDEDKDGQPKLKRPSSGLHQAEDDEMCRILEKMCEEDED